MENRKKVIVVLICEGNGKEFFGVYGSRKRATVSMNLYMKNLQRESVFESDYPDIWNIEKHDNHTVVWKEEISKKDIIFHFSTHIV